MAQKGELHIRNKHNGQYDFPLLIENYPPLKRFVSLNPLGVQTINFFNPQAVKALNKALLISYYGIRYWDIPKQYLCPPIPGRADYIHYIADLIQPDRVAKDLQAEDEDANEQKTKRRCLDVGVGANCIYPIIGHTEYGWTFVGSDIDPVSIENARKIVTCNPVLAHKIDLRLQKDSQKIFDGIIMPDEYFDVTICNPPFHSSKEEAEDGTLRKLSSLKGTKVKKVQLNFGGSANGAMIIAKNRIRAAGCILPVAQTNNLPKEMGLRHRSGLGMSLETDAIVIIVSEERGKISVAHNGNIQVNVTGEELQQILSRSKSSNANQTTGTKQKDETDPSSK